jgi:hypothetical protein
MNLKIYIEQAAAVTQSSLHNNVIIQLPILTFDLPLTSLSPSL